MQSSQIILKKLVENSESKYSVSRKRKNLCNTITQSLVYSAEVGVEIGKTIVNPRLTIPFFSGNNIFPGIPHFNGNAFLGSLGFDSDKAEELSKVAMKTRNGIASYWSGPFLPALYVVSNDSRRALVQEAHVGSINKYAEDYLSWLTGDNGAMINFLAFTSINSTRYKLPRKFLMRFFHANAKNRIPEIDIATKNYLKQYTLDQRNNTRSLREFISLLVLNTSSQMLGLTGCTLDKLYLENQRYRYAIDNVAQYEISETIKPEFEEILFNLFCEILKRNFDEISIGNKDEDFIQCVFESRSLLFPKKYEDFFNLPKKEQYAISMVFVSVMLGGLIHSTINSLDWALARLFKDASKFTELIELMKRHADLDLTCEKNFDKSGSLAKLSEWVLQNVYLYPTFSHQFFFNSKPLAETLPDKNKISIPARSVIIVNYLKCNIFNKNIDTNNFAKSLSDDSTIGKFVMNKEVSSFGGSKISKDNKKSRICPGAKTSLYEQMVIIARLLRDYNLKLSDSKQLSCDIDNDKFPLCSRKETGSLEISPKFPDFLEKKPIRHYRKIV